MPSWLVLLLAVLACVLWVGLEAAMTTGKRHSFGEAVKTVGGVFLLFTVIALVVVGWRFTFGS